MWQAKIWHSDASYTRRLSKIPPSTPFARPNIRSVVVRTGGREDGEGATVSPHTACVSSCTHTAIPVHVYMTVLHARRADSPGQRKTAAGKHAQRGDHCSVSPVPRPPGHARTMRPAPPLSLSFFKNQPKMRGTQMGLHGLICIYLYLAFSFSFSIPLYLCLCSIAVTVTALLPTRLCRLAVFLVKPTFSQIVKKTRTLVFLDISSFQGIEEETSSSFWRAN